MTVSGVLFPLSALKREAQDREIGSINSNTSIIRFSKLTEA